MGKSHLTLVTPTTVNRTVTPRRRPNSELRTREYLTEDEVTRLMESAKQNRYGHRDATMILIGYRHGLRASELVDLRWEQIDFASATLHVRRVKRGTLTPDTLLRWLEDARPDDAASADKLLPLLAESSYLRGAFRKDTPDKYGHWRISYMPLPPKERPPLRHPHDAKVILAALIRAWEMSGACVFLHLPNSRGIERREIYQPTLRLGGLRTTLPRILFGLSGGGRLMEVDGQFRVLAPSSFEYSPHIDQNQLLEIVRKHDGGEANARLLEALHTRFKEWHRDELATMMGWQDGSRGNGGSSSATGPLES